MKGTPKQIAWATALQEKAISAIRKLADQDPDEAGKAMCAVRIAAIEGAEYASDIIEVFKDCCLNGDWRHDIQAIASQYRVNPGYTDGQKKIMCKGGHKDV